MKMTRVRITEVHSYSNPPEAVENVMKAIFIILGESFTNLVRLALVYVISQHYCYVPPFATALWNYFLRTI